MLKMRVLVGAVVGVGVCALVRGGDDPLAGLWDARDAYVGQIEEEANAAAKRIAVHPQCEAAAAGMARGEFAEALEILRCVLAEQADDPYACYLAGLCAAETGRFADGARHFARVLEREPTSHTSRLLSEFCAQAARRTPPLAHEVVLECYDAGLAAAERELGPQPEKKDESPAGLAVQTFGLPRVGRDPLLYKIDREARGGRGPLQLDPERVVRGALHARDTFERFLAWSLAEDAQSQRELERQLDAPEHAATARALRFVARYYADGERYEEGGPEFEAELEAVQRALPEDGLWKVLAIAYRGPGGDDGEYPALDKAEFELLRAGASAPRFMLPHDHAVVAGERLLQRAGSPWAALMAPRLAEQAVPSVAPALRNVSQRARALAEQRFKAGDTEGGCAVLTALERLSERLRLPEGQPDSVLLMLIRAAHRAANADVALQHLPSSDTERWLKYQRMRLEAQATTLRLHEVTDRVLTALPLPLLARAERWLTDGTWTEWKVRRAERLAAKDPEPIRAVLREAREAGRAPRVKMILEAGILRHAAALPDLRAMRAAALDESALWAVVWTLGALGDRESEGWLREQAKSERAWLRLAAEEALRKVAAGGKADPNNARE